MIIRGDYYGWDDSLVLASMYRNRLKRMDFADHDVAHSPGNISDVGMLYLKTFLHNLDTQADCEATLAFARAFLVEVAI